MVLDSSALYDIDHWKDDLVQHTAPASCCTASPDGEGVGGAGRLAFANGVALAADASYVAVAETGARTSCGTG
ncbi:MAG: hypothetical protein R2734_02580 [Nocardioides sp.]